MHFKKGFTLSEILIAFAVLGVVAVLVIPTFMKVQQNKDTVATLEQSRSILAQATKMAETQFGSIKTWNLNMTSQDIYKNYYKNNLKIGMDCTGTSEKCWIDTEDFRGKGSAGGGEAYGIVGTAPVSFTLQNGQNYTITKVERIEDKIGVFSELNNSVVFMTDINGYKSPNKMGQDVFVFVLTERGIIPAGADNDSGNCKKNSYLDDDFWDCSAKVLNEGTLDYL